MGFDLAGMGDVAQGMSDMRDAQNKQRAASQAAEDNAGRLRQFQQAEVDRQAQSRLISQQSASDASIRNGPTGYNNVAINTPVATNATAPIATVPATPAAPLPAVAPTPAPAPSAGLALPSAPTPQPVASVPTTPAQATIAANHAAMTHIPLPAANPNVSTWDRLKTMAGNKYTPENNAAMALPRGGDANAPTSFAQLDSLNMPHRPITPTPVPSSNARATALPQAVTQWAPEVSAAANNYGIDPRVALANMSAESGGDANAKNKDGSTAGGLYQFTDPTAKQYSLGNKFDPHANIDAYMRMTSDNLAKFGGDYAKAVAAHHDGAGRVQAAVQKYGANWMQGLNPGTSDYVNKILATAGQQPQDMTGGQPPMPTTMVPDNTGSPAAQKVVLDAKKVWNTVSSLSTPQDDAIRENSIKYLNMRIQASHDPVEQQTMMAKVEALHNEGDEADAMHAYTGASNGDPDAMQALAGIYEERTGSQIGLTMQGSTLVAYNKGADGNPQVLFSGSPHDVASRLLVDVSPAAKAASLQIQQKAQEAAAIEAPKTAASIAVETIKANASSQDKQLSNMTRIDVAKVAGHYRLKAALAAAGFKLNEVKVNQGKNPGDPTIITKGANLYTYQPGKTGGGFTSPDRIVPIDMSASNTPTQTANAQTAGLDDGSDEEE